ncbi:MAG: hypothetical protein WBA13_16835 [Microcoleaceae cyanobacterium]
MVTIDEIEAAIHQLPDNEIRELATRLQDYINNMWDQQLKSELKSGKLDALIARAERDIAANRVKNLDEILDNT